MRRIPVRAVVIAVAAVQLGGCSSFLGINFARKAAPVPEAEPATAAATNHTEAGRNLLADDQTGAAVAAFQKAIAEGEPQAPALNGLGVAFARLGRFDLAHRFFSQAIALDPADARYADNMTRLMRSPALAMRRDADIAAAAQAQAASALASAPAQAAKPELGKIERLSRGEVRIVTAPPGAQPIARTVNSAAAGGFKPIVRVALADKREEDAKGYVRVVLPEPVAAEAAPAKAAPVSKEVRLP